MSIDELWATILKQSSPSTAVSSSKTVVFLGDSLCGKRTLLSKFCGQDGEIYRGHGLGYDYLPVKSKVVFDLLSSLSINLGRRRSWPTFDLFHRRCSSSASADKSCASEQIDARRLNHRDCS